MQISILILCVICISGFVGLEISTYNVATATSVNTENIGIDDYASNIQTLL